jgi:hypothetical protein
MLGINIEKQELPCHNGFIKVKEMSARGGGPDANGVIHKSLGQRPRFSRW